MGIGTNFVIHFTFTDCQTHFWFLFLVFWANLKGPKMTETLYIIYQMKEVVMLIIFSYKNNNPKIKFGELQALEVDIMTS